jgi:hypothetical protein
MMPFYVLIMYCKNKFVACLDGKLYGTLVSAKKKYFNFHQVRSIRFGSNEGSKQNGEQKMFNSNHQNLYKAHTILF